jgi:hypothetical protein
MLKVIFLESIPLRFIETLIPFIGACVYMWPLKLKLFVFVFRKQTTISAILERGRGTVLPEMLTELFVRNYFQQNEHLIYFFSFLWHKIIILISNMFIYAKIMAIKISLKCTGSLQICIHPHWYFIFDTGLLLRSIELFIIQTRVNVNPIEK